MQANEMLLTPEFVTEAIQRGTALFSEGRLDSAEVMFAMVADTPQTQSRALVAHMRGLIADRQGERQRARQLLRQAIELQPEAPSAYANLGRILQDDGQTAGAMAAFAAALTLNPEVADHHFGLAAALEAVGMTDLAVLNYQDGLRLDPSARLAESALNRALASPAPTATKTAERPMTDPVLVDALFVEGCRLHQAGALDRARRFYERALSLDPDHVNSLCNLGALEQSQDATEAARTLLERAVLLAPMMAAPRRILADSLRIGGEIGEAIVHYHRTIELAPKDAAAHAGLALALRTTGDLDAALRHFQTATEIDPQQSPAFFQAVGETLTGLGHLENAERAFHYAATLAPDAAAHPERQ